MHCFQFRNCRVMGRSYTMRPTMATTVPQSRVRKHLQHAPVTPIWFSVTSPSRQTPCGSRWRADHKFEVGLRQRHQRAIHNAHYRQHANTSRHEPMPANVESHGSSPEGTTKSRPSGSRKRPVHHHAGQQHRCRSRRSHVACRRPRVKRHMPARIANPVKTSGKSLHLKTHRRPACASAPGR